LYRKVARIFSLLHSAAVHPFFARVLPFALLAVACLKVPLTLLGPTGLPRLKALRTELSQVETDNRQALREIERLRLEIKALRDDPEAVERIARDQLGMVRKSEVIFQFGARAE
jgi:cell division protein FtsB